MTQVLEGVTFSPAAYYDALHYHTTSGKLKNCTSGLKWFVLTKERPLRKFKLRIHPKSKRMNEFTFAGLLTLVPAVSTLFQIPIIADTTNVNHVDCQVRIRYNEWNENFNHAKV